MSTDRERARELTAQADEGTAQRLLDADARVSEALAEVELARIARAEVIARAIDDDGWTLARIGEVLGVTRQRVGQLRKGE